ncbi:MAG: DUF302 domain-containing protein [Microthrixaceae bacterium]
MAPSSHPADQRSALWPLSFAPALDLLLARLSDCGLLVLGIVDTTRIMAAAGHEVPEVRQVLAFHPRFMAQVLQVDPAMAVHAPLKLTVIERNGATELRCLDPLVAFDAPALESMARELARCVDETLAHPPLPAV